jgi:radical SAM superfamily enzyme YgiQ (UPF0313 family)
MRRRALLVQLPIPPAGHAPVKGNVPLAGAYLKMYAELKGVGERWQIDLLPTADANTLGDAALVEAILARDPHLVGFTCYLWNIDRTLWIAERLKARRPELILLVGGPEITADNNWTLNHPAVDYAAIGEGEQTFVELLNALDAGVPLAASPPVLHQIGTLADKPVAPDQAIAGIHTRGMTTIPPFRKPLPHLNDISSPYLAGILDAADEKMLLLETIRGCIYKCKFCYYPKSYDDLYYVAEEKIVANLRHARERGATEVVLLDPTLNQGRNFDQFVQLLARENPDKQFTYFGELRAEGIKETTAKLLREANFSDVEIGLQSIDPLAMDLMDRKNNLKAFERGVRSLLDVGIRVKVDLIIGLPGDTMESVRRGLDYLHTNRFFSEIQVFNLAILPGTAFRYEAEQLGLEYQKRTPYYVMKTPTLDFSQMHELMSEAQTLFDIEFDPWEEPKLDFSPGEIWPAAALDASLAVSRAQLTCWNIDLDAPGATGGLSASAPPAEQMAQAFTIRLRGDDIHAQRETAAAAVRAAVDRNPHGTFQIVVEPTADPERVTPETIEALLAAAFATTSYLDRFYAVMPGRPKGAKRVLIVVSVSERERLGRDWADELGQFATIVWQTPNVELVPTDLDSYECLAAMPTVL